MEEKKEMAIGKKICAKKKWICDIKKSESVPKKVLPKEIGHYFPHKNKRYLFVTVIQKKMQILFAVRQKIFNDVNQKLGDPIILELSRQTLFYF